MAPLRGLHAPEFPRGTGAVGRSTCGLGARTGARRSRAGLTRPVPALGWKA
ncbi:hypothetical protein ACFFX0_08980 [Citricoccus parietis]|uniref:Uncharacterized protein n=1 Tax=Citricoccus parietis TaxID=592307 RepID=A0ABV5FXD0_9MICC